MQSSNRRGFGQFARSTAASSHQHGTATTQFRFHHSGSSSGRATFIAEEDETILGTYYMRPNQAGGGNHVCNCGFVTGAEATGRGVARQTCEHALAHARSRGYRGMQFNFVVSTNERAVRLWQKLGFEIVGRLPLAFHHPIHGYVDALVMFRAL